MRGMGNERGGTVGSRFGDRGDGMEDHLKWPRVSGTVGGARAEWHHSKRKR